MTVENARLTCSTKSGFSFNKLSVLQQTVNSLQSRLDTNSSMKQSSFLHVTQLSSEDQFKTDIRQDYYLVLKMNHALKRFVKEEAKE